MSNVAMMMGLSSSAGGFSIADVFSTTLYTGTSSLQTITNGVDLSSNGGFVWTKSRTATSGDSHYVFDTERGASAALFTNLTNAQSTASGEGVVAFNSDGFDVNGSSRSNTSGVSYVSWTWRKAPKFFDVVTYSGTGVAGRTVSHNLGSAPGCIIIKKTDSTSSWTVYHRGMDSTAPEDYGMYLNDIGARIDSNAFWNDTAPTSTDFTVGGNNLTNGNSSTYVAYVFAHNEDLIQCGSYTGTGTAGTTIDLGWKPQWVIIKRTDVSASWNMFDTARGWLDGVTTGDSKRLYANTNGAEGNANGQYITDTGFYLNKNYGGINISGGNYIYMAIKAED